MQFYKTNRLAYVNFLRTKYEAWNADTLVKSYPYYLGVDPTSALCQLRCPHCPTGIENASRRTKERVSFRNRSLLDVSLFDALIDELGDYLFLIMFYNWGEPLLHKKLPELIRKAKAKNIYTEIHSNMSLHLSDQYLEDLLTSGIDHLAGSIDGFSQESYQIYRRGGHFELAKGNLEKLVRIREKLNLKTKIVWNFLIFSFNEHEVPLVREFCEARGIDFNPGDPYTDNPDWLPSHRKNQLTTIEPSSGEPLADAPPPAASATPCRWHYDYSWVNADGSVSPCCASWEQKDDFGVVEPGLVSFADIWNNNLYRKSRAAFANKSITGLDKIDSLCLRCPYGGGIQNQYSYLDAGVISQFASVFADSDPLLAQGFSLLADKDKFVDFFAKNLITDFSPTISRVPIAEEDVSEAPSLAPAESGHNSFQAILTKLAAKFNK